MSRYGRNGVGFNRLSHNSVLHPEFSLLLPIDLIYWIFHYAIERSTSLTLEVSLLRCLDSLLYKLFIESRSNSDKAKKFQPTPQPQPPEHSKAGPLSKDLPDPTHRSCEITRSRNDEKRERKVWLVTKIKQEEKMLYVPITLQSETVAHSSQNWTENKYLAKIILIISLTTLLPLGIFYPFLLLTQYIQLWIPWD